MTEDDFWDLIEESRREVDPDNSDGNMEHQSAHVVQLLVRRSPEDIVAFRNHFRRFIARSFHWDLWAIAYILGNGCSDDYFEYFRSWLISMGRVAYFEALKDPISIESLARRRDVEDVFFERLLYAADDAYREKTGREIEALPSDESPPDDVGKPWTEDELWTRYPVLCEKYLT